MANFIMNIIIWTFALFGFFKIIEEAFYKSRKNTYMIVKLGKKEDENEIEEILNSLVFKILYNKKDNINQILIMDLDSNTTTKATLNKIEKKYKCVKLIDWESCKDIVDIKI